MPRHGVAFGSLVASLLMMTGCGQRTYPVTLSFRLADGSPLPTGFASVQHTSDATILGGGPVGADGMCHPSLRGRSTSGLPAGTYRIGVAGVTPSSFDTPPPPLPFDTSYTSPAESGLTVAVGPNTPEQTEFTLAKPR